MALTSIMTRLHPFKACFLAMALALLPAGAFSMPSDQLETALGRVAHLQEKGNLAESDALVQELLEQHASTLAPEQRRALEFEVERSRRIRGDYGLTEERLIEVMSERLVDFDPAEVAQWEAAGKLDFKIIDGEKRYVNASAANLYKRYPEIEARRATPAPTTWSEYLYEHMVKVKEETACDAQITGEPRKFRITMTITVRPGTVPEGETIRCWMPFPQQFQAQSGVALLESSPAVKWMNPPEYPTRSLYFEQPSQGSEPTVFSATYTVTTHPRRVEIDPARVAAADQTIAPEFEYFVREQPPHIVFSDRIRRLATEIVAEESNPALKAQRIYIWLSENLRYSFAREYSTLRNIPEYVLDNKYGDCGQTALLFIALCRAAGVPARWQSGWVIYPQFRNLHDWTEIYLAPYGWVPVDPDFGVNIWTGFRNLTREQRIELRDFYFGGLDAYRLTVNREHGYPHYPPKRDFRSDDVDFQRGELETASGENIYFDRFGYRLTVEFLDQGGEDDSGEKEAAAPAASPSPMLGPGVIR